MISFIHIPTMFGFLSEPQSILEEPMSQEEVREMQQKFLEEQERILKLEEERRERVWQEHERKRREEEEERERRRIQVPEIRNKLAIYACTYLYIIAYEYFTETTRGGGAQTKTGGGVS